MEFSSEQNRDLRKQFFNDLALTIGREDDPHRHERMLYAVLRAIRNHLSIHDVARLMDFWPEFLRKDFTREWDTAYNNQFPLRSLNDFINEVIKEVWKEHPEEVLSAEEANNIIREVLWMIGFYTRNNYRLFMRYYLPPLVGHLWEGIILTIPWDKQYYA